MVLKTPLHANHVALNAKMGEFAGYDMPLYYELGVMGEHNWTREKAGLFDVSHMGQVILEGEGVVEFLERLTPSSFAPKKHGRAQYTVLTNEEGGIIDDLIITRMDDNKFFVVINAGCKDKDIAWMKENLPAGIQFTYLENHALIALQGVAAERVMRDVMEADLSDMPYMTLIETKAPCGTDIFVSRLGYTGEDGFEICVPAEKAADAWSMLVGHDDVKPVGLAARDSLRLEMGYPLYGHDIDATTSPIEADLAWIMGKGANTGFIGAERVLRERESGTQRKRIGFELTDKGVAREGAEVLNEAGEKIGDVTSGGPSPTLGKSIGMAYVPPEYAQVGAKIQISVRGRSLAAEVSGLPFMAAKTKSMKKKAA